MPPDQIKIPPKWRNVSLKEFQNKTIRRTILQVSARPTVDRQAGLKVGPGFIMGSIFVTTIKQVLAKGGQNCHDVHSATAMRSAKEESENYNTVLHHSYYHLPVQRLNPMS
mmetsp:Transcript_12657/g.22753  ORF Transcript_12657/g.22753 Transcript_12657/m.22753 type:complete len:111 (-) Transcript_12657:336-668(-)